MHRQLTKSLWFVYSVDMYTYNIINDNTGEVVETASNYQEALGIAEYLSITTKTLHFVPVGVVQQLVYAV